MLFLKFSRSEHNHLAKSSLAAGLLSEQNFVSHLPASHIQLDLKRNLCLKIVCRSYSQFPVELFGKIHRPALNFEFTVASFS